MKQLTQRQKLVGGVFSIVSVAWTIDMLTGGPTPQQANATPSTALLTTELELPAAPENIDALIEAINQRQLVREPFPFIQLERDIFEPSEGLAPAMTADIPDDISPSDASPVSQPQNTEIPFESLHTLRGVISGRTPLALIDGRLAPIGAVIDGYRLVEIESASVTLEKDGRRTMLHIISTDNKGN